MSLQCQLSGLWRNEQDSLMEISAVRDDGSFQGKYLTRVTLASACARASPLMGAQQQPGEGGWPTFAFTVRWDKFSSKCWDTQGRHHRGTGSHTGSQQEFSCLAHPREPLGKGRSFQHGLGGHVDVVGETWLWPGGCRGRGSSQRVGMHPY